MFSINHLSVVPTPAQSLYGDWQKQILCGNRVFDEQQLQAAMMHYNKAVAIADQLVVEHSEFHMAVVAVIVSHHNLADVFLAQSRTDCATDELLSVYNKLLKLQTQFVNCPDKLEALMWGLRRTYTALLHHLKDHHRNKIIPVPQMPTICARQDHAVH